MKAKGVQNFENGPDSLSFIKDLARERQEKTYYSTKDEHGQDKASAALLFLWGCPQKDQVLFFSTPGVLPVLAQYGLLDSVIFMMDKFPLPSQAKILEAPDALVCLKRKATTDIAKQMADRILRQGFDSMTNQIIRCTQDGFQRKHPAAKARNPFVKGTPTLAL